MTALKLPRPARGKTPLREALMLEYLGIIDRSPDAIADLSVESIAVSLRIPADQAKEDLLSLVCRKRILLASSQFAILSRLSRKLKQERDRNRIRAKRSQPADWSLHRRASQIFPALRGPVVRPATYNRPACFETLLSQHASHHKRDCPANVEIITEACYPGELTSVLTFIEEQRSANRSVVLLYTRKAVYVGVVRAPKR